MNESASPVVVADQPLLILRGIHKHFPGVHALRGVPLKGCRGGVQALVGEDGAGQSTLRQILAGVYRPDAGTIHFDGRPNITIENERAAQRLGIAIVFQECSLFDELSVPAPRRHRTLFRIPLGRTSCSAVARDGARHPYPPPCVLGTTFLCLSGIVWY